jgi:Asp/Glu/Hydantoin racemase
VTQDAARAVEIRREAVRRRYEITCPFFKISLRLLMPFPRFLRSSYSLTRAYLISAPGTSVQRSVTCIPRSDPLLAVCRYALTQDGAEAIGLGCTGMADLAERIGDALGVPVVDGVTAGVKLVEALVALGLRTSKAGDLAFPLPKAYTGLVERFAPDAGC